MHNTPPTAADQALIKAPDSASRDGFPTSGNGSGLSPLTAVRKHLLVAILIFLVVLGAGAPLVLKKATPVYFASSVIYVAPTVKSTLKDFSQQRPQFDIDQKVLMIPRYDVVVKTIQKLRTMGIDARQPGESEQAAAERLGKELEVSHAADSYEISVGMHSKSPQDIAELLNTLAATFIETSRSEEFYGEDRRIDALGAERSRLDTELNQDLQTRSDIARELGVIGFDQLPADKSVETTRMALALAKRQREG